MDEVLNSMYRNGIKALLSDSNLVVKCSSRAEANEVLKLTRRWYNTELGSDTGIEYWAEYEQDTCYRFRIKRRNSRYVYSLRRGSADWYRSRGYKVVSFCELMNDDELVESDFPLGYLTDLLRE